MRQRFLFLRVSLNEGTTGKKGLEPLIPGSKFRCFTAKLPPTLSCFDCSISFLLLSLFGKGQCEE